MKVLKLNLNPEWLITHNLERVDYYDVYGIEVPPEVEVPLEKLPIFFMRSFPRWLGVLMRIREAIAKPLGLKTAKDLNVDLQLKNFKADIGQSIALFKALGKSENEILTGENDKHLDFRLSFIQISNGKKTIAMATTVMIKNLLGKVYFFPVKFVHRLIMPIILRNTMNQILNNK